MSQPDKHQKQFDPTAQRLKKAREEGNVFQSKEVVSVGLLLAALLALYYGLPSAFEALRQVTAQVYRSASTTTLTAQSASLLFARVGTQLAIVLVPFFGLLIVVGGGLSVLQTGWNVTLKPLKPKANRISPLQGLKRLFSSKGLFEVFKALVKIAVVGPLAYFFIKNRLHEVLHLHTLSLPAILGTVATWFFVLAMQLLGALALLSGLDFAFEKWKYKEDLKMSKKEIEDEQKENEGNPHVKSRRRERAQELARRPRLDHAVLQADVVVTNPTHYAVALRYDPAQDVAPRVLAKGLRKRALRIKALARELDVPTVENRPLAHALYDTIPEEEEITQELYPAVAAILAQVYQERDRRS